jgi:hypothetical protein
MNVTINSASVASLKRALKDTAFELRKQVRIALNATAKKSKSITNKVIREELANVPAKDINFTMKVHLSENTDKLSAKLEVKKTDRLSLRIFKPRQVKAGVSYQISKSKGRKTAMGTFINSTKLYGGVFKRAGKQRLPILKLRGPSPWGVMTKGKKLGPSKKETQAELAKQIERRVRFITLKKSGAI